MQDGDRTKLAALAALQLEALRHLAISGETDTACRLAGRAYMLLHRSDPGLARHFDVLLHRMTRELRW